MWIFFNTLPNIPSVLCDNVTTFESGTFIASATREEVRMLQKTSIPWTGSDSIRLNAIDILLNNR